MPERRYGLSAGRENARLLPQLDTWFIERAGPERPHGGLGRAWDRPSARRLAPKVRSFVAFLAVRFRDSAPWDAGLG